MEETRTQKLLHTAADMRAQLDDDRGMPAEKRAFMQQMLDELEDGFRARLDELREFQDRFTPRPTDLAHGRLVQGYVSGFLQIHQEGA